MATNKRRISWNHKHFLQTNQKKKKKIIYCSVKPHSWLNWCISHFVHAKMNKWMSEYLPHPLLRKCGSSLQYLWWNGFYCECSWGKQAEHILHMQHQDHLSRPGILRAPKSPPGIWSSLPASPHLLLLSPFAHLSSFAHWAQVTHILSFPQTPNFSLWAWITPEFLASSGHISNVSSSERCYRISPTHNALYFIPIFSFSNLSKKKVFKSRNWFYSFGSHNPSLDHKMGSRRRVWYLDSNSCFCSKGAVWLGARFHL